MNSTTFALFCLSEIFPSPLPALSSFVSSRCFSYSPQPSYVENSHYDPSLEHTPASRLQREFRREHEVTRQPKKSMRVEERIFSMCTLIANGKFFIHFFRVSNFYGSGTSTRHFHRYIPHFSSKHQQRKKFFFSPLLLVFPFMFFVFVF